MLSRRLTSRQTCVAARTPRRAVVCRASYAAPGPLPPVINWHLEPRCNYGCKFCFATFEDVKSLDAPPPDPAALLRVPALLAEAGASRITFVGGEPTLHPQIFELIAAAKAAGLFTSMVTNGSRLDAAGLLRLRPVLDQIAFSVDASNDDLHVAMGRGVAGKAGGHLARVKVLWGLARELGFSLKLNTVVTRINLHDDMVPLVLELGPARWKLFQVLPAEGQNTGAVDDLLISADEFGTYVARHRAALAAAATPAPAGAAAGSGGAPRAGGGRGGASGAAVGGCPVELVAEDNSLLRGTYAMLDAHCWFYSNTDGPHSYGPSFSLGPGAPSVAEAWAAVGAKFDGSGFVARGGVYQWGQGEEAAARQRGRWADGAAGGEGSRRRAL